MNQQMMKPVLPWWRVPTMWLVTGGPALVVVASLATLAIALRFADTPLHVAPSRDVETVRHAPSQVKAMTPAGQGRNHAVSAAR